MTTPQMRPELADLPTRMRGLPLDKRGYPVPKFVQWINGEPDFRFMDQEHWIHCVEQHLCWVCGERLGVYQAFVIGPMCTVNRTTSEPPCHLDCARWSARNCPFLSRPHMRRREDELTREHEENIAGCPIPRNPGAACVWIAKDFKIWRDDKNAPLIEIGEPTAVEWWSQGQPATRVEVEESIRTGLPFLEKLAREEKGGMEALAENVKRAERWYPAA